MEVPFLSSSAISREHYNLVQRVESAATPQQVDGVLLQQVEVVRRRLGKRAPSSQSECVESLVLLLYCWTATSLGGVTRSALEFALPHAVTLAEAGSTIKNKRTGYMFCTEIMRNDDELQIMLVNTLRKDLEDPHVARICLALDVLLLNCPADAIPAVTPRLIDLLAHHSQDVKRKSIGVIRRISIHEQDILSRVKDKILFRLKDQESCVVTAALSILPSLTQARLIKRDKALRLAVEGLSETTSRKTPGLQIKFVEVIRKLIPEVPADDFDIEVSNGVAMTLFHIIEKATNADHALVLESFRALSNCPVQVLAQHLSFSGLSILSKLLDSTKPNAQYLCMLCLLALDASLWAGTTGEIPPVFDEGQVHMIMSLLNSPDNVIRSKTLQVLHEVDPQILSMHLTQMLTTFQRSPANDRSGIAQRILDTAAVYDENGGSYATHLKEIGIGLEDKGRHKGKKKAPDSGASRVSEDVVEQVLLHLRKSSDDFRKAFIDATARIPVSDAGPTLTLVIAASVCEYGALSSIPQENILQGLAARLDSNPPAIQEALLLAMLRVTARCDSALPPVSDQVRLLHGVSRSHIRRRCEQYLSLSEQMSYLKHIAARARSDTLPDFLLALEIIKAQSSPVPSPKTRYKSPVASENPPPRSPVTTGKLRYEAYDPPHPVPKLTRRLSSTPSVRSQATSSRSDRSDSISSSHSYSQGPRGGSPVAGTDPDDSLSRTLTAGDLALAALQPDFARSAPISSSVSQAGDNRHHADPTSPPVEDIMAKVDLIALDSPFLAEPPHSMVEEPAQQTGVVNFQTVWDDLKDSTTVRGWSETSPEQVKQRFEAVPDYHATTIPPEIEPYKGEIKVAISSNIENSVIAALRLRLGEEGSTLWQLRCFDATLRTELRRLIEG